MALLVTAGALASPKDDFKPFEEVSKGFEKVGSTAEFLGLTDTEEMLVAMKLALATNLKSRRQYLKITQQELAKRKESDVNRAVIDNLESAKVFMAENGSKPNIKTTSSGLQYEHLSSGKGAKPHLDATVVVHYEGKLSTGKVFDSSIQRGTPAEFGLTQVIPGWTEGLQLMKVGGKTRFFIPPDLGYGPGGTRGIPPNSVLIFEVELLEIIEPGA